MSIVYFSRLVQTVQTPLFCDIFYHKETSAQVDFVIAKDGNVQELIQVSYDISIEKTRNREIRGLKNAAKKLKCNNLTLVTFEEHETIEEDGYTINVIPATKWLLDKQMIVKNAD